MRALWHVLARHRDYRLLLSAGLVSLVGDWVLRVGLAYYVYELTGSTLASAATLLASLVPQIVLGSLAGVYVDRWNRRRTMVVTNVLLALGLLPLLAVDDRHDIWIVYLVTVVQSTLAQFFITAEMALVPSLVPAGDLVTANALNGQNRDIARLVGAALGGVTTGLGGITLLTLTDMVSFVLAAGILTLMRRSPGETPPRPPRRDLLREWADGARIALRSRTLRVLLLFAVITGIGEAAMATLMAPFVRDVLHGSAGAYGLILSVQAAGGIVGGLGAAALGPRFAPRHLLGYGALVFGALDLVLFLYPLLAPALWPAVVLMAAVGLPAAFAMAGLITIFQTATGDAHRGRVFGMLGTVEGAVMLVATVLAGTLGERLGIVAVIAVQGVAYCAAGLLVLLLLPGQRPGGPSPRTAHDGPALVPAGEPPQR